MTTETPATPATVPTESTIQPQALFALGQVVGTPEALRLLDNYGVNVFDLLTRHASGDWGDVCAEDAHFNDNALIHGGRLLSSYTLRSGVADTRVWIISEENFSVTTILKPEQY